MWPPGSWRVLLTLSHWPSDTWWSADRTVKIYRKAAQSCFSPVSDPFRAWVRVRARVGLGLGAGLSQRPYLDPRLPARKREHPTAPKTRATRLLGKLLGNLVTHLWHGFSGSYWSFEFGFYLLKIIYIMGGMIQYIAWETPLLRQCRN